jgi:hypothetical protein
MSVGVQEYQTAEVPVSVFNPVGLTEKPTVDRLQTRAAQAAEGIFALLDDLSYQVATCPTAEDFKEYRKSIYPRYIELTTALASIVRATLRPDDLPGLIDASLLQLQTEFSNSSYFGEDTRKEILFSIATLKSALRWLPHLMLHKPAEEKREQDRELARQYTSTATWCQFHLVALALSQERSLSVATEVLDEMLEGLRASVMAYSYVRQALDLRNLLEGRYSEELAISWDEEDEALANAL